MTGMAEEMADGMAARQTDGRIHHFLLPAQRLGIGGRGEGGAATSLRRRPPALKKWRKSITNKPSRKQVDALVELAHRVESLWQMTLRRLQIAEPEARRDITLWGGTTRTTPQPSPASRSRRPSASRTAPTSACAGSWTRGRRCGSGRSPTPKAQPADAWTSGSTPARQLLGREPEARKTTERQDRPGDGDDWEDLNAAEELNLDFAAAASRRSLKSHPWLKTCEEVADQQGFFHWELDFATVFARGGFDLQLGNPPWVRPQTDIEALLAEGDPWWQLDHQAKRGSTQGKARSDPSLAGIRDLVIDGTTDIVVTHRVSRLDQAYPSACRTAARPLSLLHGADMEACVTLWRIVHLIHPESHFTDEKAGLLRENAYASASALAVHQ